jgi:hypothetical protein
MLGQVNLPQLIQGAVLLGVAHGLALAIFQFTVLDSHEAMLVVRPCTFAFLLRGGIHTFLRKGNKLFNILIYQS